MGWAFNHCIYQSRGNFASISSTILNERPFKTIAAYRKMKEPMIKESRLHEQLQASLEKGERLVELTLESEQEAVTAKISYVGKEDFWHSNLHHLLKEKGTFNLSLSRKQFNHK